MVSESVSSGTGYVTRYCQLVSFWRVTNRERSVQCTADNIWSRGLCPLSGVQLLQLVCVSCPVPATCYLTNHQNQPHSRPNLCRSALYQFVAGWRSSLHSSCHSRHQKLLHHLGLRCIHHHFYCLGHTDLCSQLHLEHGQSHQWWKGLWWVTVDSVFLLASLLFHWFLQSLKICDKHTFVNLNQWECQLQDLRGSQQQNLKQ